MALWQLPHLGHGMCAYTLFGLHCEVTIYYSSYKEARTQLDLIFGPKFNEKFPKVYLESNGCGDGFWESTGKGNYEHPGVDAWDESLAVGDEVS